MTTSMWGPMWGVKKPSIGRRQTKPHHQCKEWQCVQGIHESFSLRKIPFIRHFVCVSLSVSKCQLFVLSRIVTTYFTSKWKIRSNLLNNLQIYALKYKFFINVETLAHPIKTIVIFVWKNLLFFLELNVDTTPKHGIYYFTYD
jgi:hypothetical protein